jgi:hypothetical protein
MSGWPAWFLVLFAATIAGAVLFLIHQVKLIRRQKRNLDHWAKDEPLEGDVDRWD